MKIAIVGTAPNTFFDAPYNDESWEIWSLNGAHERIPRYNRWFEMHTWKHIVQEKMSPEYYQHLQNAASKGSLYTIEAFPYETLIFPREELISLFGRYFTSSIGWMIGFAIQQGATEIALYGVNMSGEEEYEKQRAGCEYLLGIAKGKGIKITLPDDCPLLKGSLYCEELFMDIAGYDRRAKKAYEDALGMANYYKGVVDTIKELKCKWG
jgi:hypothetical protein